MHESRVFRPLLDRSDRLYKGLTLGQTLQWAVILLTAFNLNGLLPDNPTALHVFLFLGAGLGGLLFIHQKYNGLEGGRYLLVRLRFRLERDLHAMPATTTRNSLALAPTNIARHTAPPVSPVTVHRP